LQDSSVIESVDEYGDGVSVQIPDRLPGDGSAADTQYDRDSCCSSAWHRAYRSDVYVGYARSRNTDQRISIEQADACALPFPNDGFDRAFSMQVLQFIPEPERAVAEMKRVVRSGGVTAVARGSGISVPNPTGESHQIHG
jgi:SAM-dependent methyltransferase